MNIINKKNGIELSDILAFLAISLFYLFETAQMSYYNVLAPAYLVNASYDHESIGAISAAYYYGDVAGLFPIGYALDRFSFRATLIFSLAGSIVGAFFLFMSDSFSMQWISRFICGFCGGTFSFVGGIRIVSLIFKDRFTYGFSLFLSAGILGAMLSQYPLLLVVNHFGPRGAMFVMFSIGAIIAIFNYLFLHMPIAMSSENTIKKYKGTIWMMLKEIVFNLRNWLDVLMIVLLETPGTILGTLWGVVLIMSFFHFNSGVSSLVVTFMLLGSMIGLPALGYVADKYNNQPWIISVSTTICILLIILMFFYHSSQNILMVSLLFFGLGFFYSCQTVGFHWVTSSMKPELIGRNSAFNSIIFMSANGGLKQLSAYFLSIPAIYMTKTGPSANLLCIIFISLSIVVLYAAIRRFLFAKGFLDPVINKENLICSEIDL